MSWWSEYGVGWIGMEWERKRRRGMGWDEVRRGKVKGGEVGGRVGVVYKVVQCSASYCSTC
jgi:hypothetical protein